MRRIPHSATLVPLLTTALLLLGWRGSVDTTTTPPPPEHDTRVAPIRSEADDVKDLAYNVQYAGDRVEGGAAVKRLQRWQIAHGTTFKIDAVNPDTNATIPNPSTHSGPFLANVTVFRG